MSIHLSNGDRCPHQIDPFLTANTIRLDQCVGLQSMSVKHVRSLAILNRILDQCSMLPFLTRLSIDKAKLSFNESGAQSMIDRIWALPHLVTCSLRIQCYGDNSFPQPTIVSKSLTSLIIQEVASELLQIVHLCDHTPNLQSLSMGFFGNPPALPATQLLPIRRLIANFESDTDVLEQLCECLPHLTHLTIEIHEMWVDGYVWERIIRKSLPKLKKLRFKMRYEPENTDRPDEEINFVLNSFRTPFWIDEHQWFVRAEYNGTSEEGSTHWIDVFTLPYVFDSFPRRYNFLRSQSTCPDVENNALTCRSVTSLFYRSADWTDPILSSVQFPCLQNLSLLLPFDPQFLSVVCNFERLASLYVDVDIGADPQYIQSHLQCILDRARYLRSLSFGSWLPWDDQRIIQTLRSSSIRELNVRNVANRSQLGGLEERQCLELSRSELGRQCETLSIHAKDRTTVLSVVHMMHNLRVLHFQCDDDDYVRSSDSETAHGDHIRSRSRSVSVTTSDDDILSSTDPKTAPDDLFVPWLRAHLPDTCLISRDSHPLHDIRMWIR